MTIRTFDTLLVANTLKKAGFAEAQAEALVAAMGEAIGGGNLATKDDIAAIKADIAEVKAGIAAQEERFTSALATHEERTQVAFATQEERFTSALATQEERFTSALVDDHY